jgi:hypothetical protein
MTKEERVIALTILICFVYGLSCWIESGIFILPTPLFPLFSILTGGYICYLHYKTDKLISIFVGVYLLIEFVCSTFLLTFLVSEENQFEFTNSPWIALGKIISSVLFFISGILYLFKGRSTQSRWLIAVFAFSFITSFFANSVAFYCLSTITLLILPRYTKVILFPLHLIGLLLLLLRSSEWVFLHFAK